MPKYLLNPFTGQLDATGAAAGPAIGQTVTGADVDSVLIVDNAGTLQDTGTMTNGQTVIGSTGNPPVRATLTGTTNQVLVVNGAGSITLSTPQDIAATSSPTFNTVIANVDKAGTLAIGSTNATTVNIGNSSSGASILGALSLTSHQIHNVTDPSSAQDAATKNYTDTTFIPLAQKAAPNGVATLDGGGKIPVGQLPSSVMTYEGIWDASTNTPTLADGVGDAGMVYLTTVAGTTDFGSGPITFAVGDWAVYSGTIWQKSLNSNAVVSVNGQTGVVTLTTTDIPEGTNLYFTNARTQAAITGGASTITTANLTIDRALISSGAGKVAVSPTTATELGYVSGVTSAIQTQLNAITGSAITSLTGDVTATGPGAAAATLASVGTAGTYGTVTTDAKGRVTSGVVISPVANGGTNSAAALSNNRVIQSSGGAIVEAAVIAAARALISDANGIPTHSTVTATELGYVSGVTSVIQTQLDGKEPTITVLPISKGGTNSGTALNNDRLMISSSGAIVEQAALTPLRALFSSGTGLPQVSTVTNIELSQLSGVNNPIQTQLDAKASRTLGNLTTTNINADLVPGSNLGINLGSPSLRIDFGYINRLGTNTGASSILVQARQLYDSSNVLALDWSGTDLDINTRKIINVVNPTSAQDAATKAYVDGLVSAEGSFSAANNQASAANVTGFAFANGSIRSFSAQVSVAVSATSSLYESFNLLGIQKGASWEMSSASVGDTSQVVFSITTAGQIQYTSGNYTGFVSATVKFKSLTTSV